MVPDWNFSYNDLPRMFPDTARRLQELRPLSVTMPLESHLGLPRYADPDLRYKRHYHLLYSRNCVDLGCRSGRSCRHISYIMYPSSTVLSVAQYFHGKKDGGVVVTISSGNTDTSSTSPVTPYALVMGSTDSSDN